MPFSRFRGFCLSPRFCIFVYLISSPFHSLPPSLSQIISWRLCLGAPALQCVGNLTFIICFLYFGNVRLTSYLREVGVGGAGCLAPPLSIPHPLLNPFLPPPHPSSLSPELRAEAFSAQGHYGTRNQAPIHHLPSTAYCRVGKAESPLVYRWFANLGKSEDSRHRESPGG